MKHVVLLVDDEPNILEGLQRALCMEPYQIVTADSARKGTVTQVEKGWKHERGVVKTVQPNRLPDRRIGPQLGGATLVADSETLPEAWSSNVKSLVADEYLAGAELLQRLLAPLGEWRIVVNERNAVETSRVALTGERPCDLFRVDQQQRGPVFESRQQLWKVKKQEVAI